MPVNLVGNNTALTAIALVPNVTLNVQIQPTYTAFPDQAAGAPDPQVPLPNAGDVVVIDSIPAGSLVTLTAATPGFPDLFWAPASSGGVSAPNPVGKVMCLKGTQGVGGPTVIIIVYRDDSV